MHGLEKKRKKKTLLEKYAQHVHDERARENVCSVVVVTVVADTTRGIDAAARTTGLLRAIGVRGSRRPRDNAAPGTLTRAAKE